MPRLSLHKIQRTLRNLSNERYLVDEEIIALDKKRRELIRSRNTLDDGITSLKFMEREEIAYLDRKNKKKHQGDKNV